MAHPRHNALNWLLLAPIAWLTTAVLLGSAPLTLWDWDSHLYATMSEALSGQPLSQWIQPQWPAGYYKQGAFQEHPAVFLWPAAVLCWLGLQGDAAAASADLGFMLVIAGLLQRLARIQWGEPAGHAAAVGWLGSFVFVQFLLRGRQEPMLTAGMLLAIYAAHRVGAHGRWGLLLALCIPWCAGVKGAAFILVIPAVLAWPAARTQTATRWLGTGVLLTVFSAWAYDALYQQLTGVSLVAAYRNIQSGSVEGHARPWFHTLYRVPYLLAAVLVWTLPWSPLLLQRLLRFKTAPLDPGTRALLWGVAVHVGFFGLFGRGAARYVFGAYPLWTLGCAAAVVQWPWVTRFLSRHGSTLVSTLLAAIPLAACLRMVVADRASGFPSWSGYFAQ